MATGKRAKSRQRLPLGERREALLRIGLEEFSRTAYDEINLEALAERAGISKGLIYHYFPSKRDYYVAALQVAGAELVARIEAAGQDAERAIGAYLTFVEEREPAYRALYRGGIGYDEEVSAVVEGTRTRILEQILAHSDAVTPGVRNALRGFIGYVEASVLDWLEHRDIPRDRLLRSWQETLVSSVQRALDDCPP
ncbi:MAG: TetR family transcriptional regulator [Polyangiaceae bacterium]